MKTSGLKALTGACTLLILGGCGGADANPPVTFVHELTVRDEVSSYRAVRRELDDRAVVPLTVQCGLLVERDSSQVPTVLYPDGYSPRLVYFQLAAADADRVRDLPWLAVVDDLWRGTYLDPEDCGPLPSGT